MPQTLDPNMTYGEYTQRRAAILSAIAGARRMLKRIGDDRYTQFIPDGVSIVKEQLLQVEGELHDLNQHWTNIQTKQRSNPNGR